MKSLPPLVEGIFLYIRSMNAPLFLRAKHWQIFVPLIAIPILTMIVFSIIMGAVIVNTRPDNFNDIKWVFYVMPVIMIIAAATQFLWQWNVAVNLRKYIHTDARLPRIKLFRVTFFVPFLFFFTMPIMMSNFIGEMENSVRSSQFGAHVGPPVNPAEILGFFFGIFFSYIVLMFCVLNNVYVVSKTIKMAEVQRKVSFSDFAADFFFILFIFPVAIWFVQPRINVIVSSDLKKAGLGNEDLLD